MTRGGSWSKLSRKAKQQRSAGAWAATQLVSGDFMNIATSNAADGIYTLNGAPSTLEAVIDVDNPNATFNPATDIDAGGIKQHDDGAGGSISSELYINTPLVDVLLTDGFTCVLDAYFHVPTMDDMAAIVVSVFDADYNWEAGASLVWGLIDRLRLKSGDGTDFDTPNVVTQNGPIKMAVTITNDGVRASINGGAVISLAGPVFGESPAQIFFSVGGAVESDTRLRSFAFYEPVEDPYLTAISAL
jgi:hypothetical protein